MNELHDSINDRAWWSKLNYLRIEARMQYIVDVYTKSEITDAQLWDVLSNFQSPLCATHAGMVYTRLGYVPFSGYPLVRMSSRRSPR